MNPKDIVSYIEGEPFINTVPVEPGITNAVMKNSVSQIIINVEAQKDEPNGYDILNRAIFYVSRMISSQKERDFSNSNYNDIKRVYSIWICMSMPENSLEHIHLVKDSIVNSHGWKGKLDIIGNEYAIPMEKDFRKDVSIMCNLSQKIKVTGIETGIEMGKREMIMKMYSKGYTTAQIADVAEIDEKQIQDIIKNAELLPV